MDLALCSKKKKSLKYHKFSSELKPQRNSQNSI